jgi:hypothetical protein
MVIFAVASQDLNFLMQLFCSVAPLYSTITVPRHVLAESPRFLSPLLGIGAPFEWIYDFPNIAVALLFGIAGACLLAGVPFFREKVLRIRVPSVHSEATDKALAVVISFTGLVLAFSLVQANGNLRNLETQVATEAHNIDQMDRLILRYGDSAISALRGPLRDYANSIVRDEWPELRKGRPSEQTTALFGPISRSILAIEPPPGRQSLIYAEMLKKVDEIAADRKARVVAATKLELPSIFWETIVGLLVILLLLATFSETTFGRAVALGCQGFGLALLVALIFIFDEPFKGQTSVSPEPIATVVTGMQARSS